MESEINQKIELLNQELAKLEKPWGDSLSQYLKNRGENAEEAKNDFFKLMEIQHRIYVIHTQKDSLENLKNQEQSTIKREYPLESAEIIRELFENSQHRR